MATQCSKPRKAESKAFGLAHSLRPEESAFYHPDQSAPIDSGKINSLEAL